MSVRTYAQDGLTFQIDVKKTKSGRDIEISLIQIDGDDVDFRLGEYKYKASDDEYVGHV